jgi:hypothetical protein
VGDGDGLRRYLDEGIVCAMTVEPLVLLQGGTLRSGFPYQTMKVL